MPWLKAANGTPWYVEDLNDSLGQLLLSQGATSIADADVSQTIADYEAAQDVTPASPLLTEARFVQDLGDPTNQVTKALSTAYASTALPRTTGKANGLKYDGSDESAAFQNLINAMNTFGGGHLTLEGSVRCDSQIVFPNTGGSHPQQAPIRISGTVVDMPGSTFQGNAPYPKVGGLDLRYPGITNTGCGTTKGSAIITTAAAKASDRGLLVTGPGIPDWCWILAVQPGVGWTVSKAARATAASVTLNTTGGRILTTGYGNLELDHLRIVNDGATASSSPYLVTTGTTVHVHDNVFVGHASKTTGSQIDEDIAILGGPGQGTALTSALTSGQAYTSLSVDAIPVGLVSGGTLEINTGCGTTQIVTLSAAAAPGATSISVQSFIANASYPARTSIYFGNWQDQTTTGAWAVPSAPFQGYGTRIHDNHFHRMRRIAAGAYVSSVSIDHNSWMHNCGSNLAQTPSTLTTALTSGSTYTSLAVTALSKPIIAGDVVQIGVGDTSQETIAAADAAAGATSISVQSFIANAAYSTSTLVLNSTEGIGAAFTSFAIPNAVNEVNFESNRVGLSGGYSCVARLSGDTSYSRLVGNDTQDFHTSNTFATYRFDRNAAFNMVIPGLEQPGLASVDDWSYSDHTPTQTVVDPGQSRPSKFPQGVDTIGANCSYRATSGSAYTFGPTYKQPNGDQFVTYFDQSGSLFFRHIVGGVNYDFLRFQNSPAGVNNTMFFSATNEGRVYNLSGHIKFQVKAGYKVYFGDTSVSSNAYALSGRLYGDALVGKAYATASRPTGLNSSTDKGAMVFDSTLGKPIWWNGTGWVDATGATV